MQASNNFETFLSIGHVLSKRFLMAITKVLTELDWDSAVSYGTPPQETR